MKIDVMREDYVLVTAQEKDKTTIQVSTVNDKLKVF